MSRTIVRDNEVRDDASSSAPWYRQRWPWLLIAGPAIVVVAGFVTLWLAVVSDDGLVADDYYKRGLLINRQLARTDLGAARGAIASVHGDGRVEVTLSGAGDAPATLRARFVHPTRAGLDRSVLLNRTAVGAYAGTIDPLTAGRWLVTIEADAWRLPTIEAATPITGLKLGIATQAR
jgi:hypothetical protein